MSAPNVLSGTKQFVYAQQDILGGTKKTNDLVVVNDADYRDSGICVGPGGAYNNMRLAYSVSDSAGSITTDTLNVNVEQLFFKNLPSAQNIRKTCNYLVADSSGNVKEGYPQFTGDINNEVNTIKDDIILIKQNLGLPLVKTISIEGILSYIAIGLCVLFLIILIILLIRMHRLNKRIEQLEQAQSESVQPSPPQPPQYPYYYPPVYNPPPIPRPPMPPPQIPQQPAYNPPQIPQQPAYNPPQIPQQPAYNPPQIPQQPAYNPPQIPQQPVLQVSSAPVSSPIASQSTPVVGSPPASPTAFGGYRRRYYY